MAMEWLRRLLRGAPRPPRTDYKATLTGRDRLRHEWVSPLYLELLHGNFHRGARGDTLDEVRRVAQAFERSDALALLDGGWRERLVAAWLVGVCKYEDLIPRLAELLLASETYFAGQGYCGALAMMPCEASAAALVAYLDRYLARPDLFYDQLWAMAALQFVDRELGTDRARAFLAPGGPWERWCAGRDPPSLPPLAELIAGLRGCAPDDR